VLPLIPALCLAPRAACSYFSTSMICLWSLVTFGVSGCVDVSFNYSTIASTSSMRSSICLVAFSYALMEASILFIYYWWAVDLVALWVDVASWFALSSILVILSTRSSITFSRCDMRDCCSLLVASWSRMSRYSCWTSFSISCILSALLLCLSSYSNRIRTADSPNMRTFSSS
jgi:hypothetical protein